MIDSSCGCIISIGLLSKSTANENHNNQNLTFRNKVDRGCAGLRGEIIETKVNNKTSLIVGTRKTSLDHMRPKRNQAIKASRQVSLLASPLSLTLLFVALSSCFSINCASCKYNCHFLHILALCLSLYQLLTSYLYCSLTNS